jgi:hypothetical protein
MFFHGESLLTTIRFGSTCSRIMGRSSELMLAVNDPVYYQMTLVAVVTTSVWPSGFASLT